MTGIAYSPTARAWSLDREAIRPALTAAQDEVVRCARVHAAPNGRYVFWIAVDARGRARVSLRESPMLSNEARDCLTAAYEAPSYPAPLEATVAWSSNSPPQSSYNLSYPIELQVNRYGFETLDGPLERGSFGAPSIRPSPARSQFILRADD